MKKAATCWEKKPANGSTPGPTERPKSPSWASSRAQWARDRRKGIERGLADHAPGAEIVAQQDALQPSVGASVTGSILQAHPDLHMVLAIVPGGGEGAYQAFLNAGHEMNDPDVFIETSTVRLGRSR